MKTELLKFDSANFLTREQMKKIKGGENPGCGDWCLAGPVVDEYKCKGNCTVCYSDGSTRYCVTRVVQELE